MRWHHLVMAVGNFKRQGGRRLRPQLVARATGTYSAIRSDRFRVPGLTDAILRDEPASWDRLEDSLTGAGAATTTTLLAALWPDCHHILDWRVLAAVAGLGVVVGGRSDLGLADCGGHEQLLPDLTKYSEVRQLLIEVAQDTNLPLSAGERALYKLTTTVQGRGMTWEQYGRALQLNLGKRSPGISDDEKGKEPSAP
jgi:hypothetical protein